MNETEGVNAYIDNATIINACSLIENPQMFDIYKLIDLESFCEAFLLHDCIFTLVGHSFDYATRNPRSSDSRNISWLYRILVAKQFLKPIVVSAGGFDYSMHYDALLDEIASKIDTEQTIHLFKEIFGNNIPWSYSSTPGQGTPAWYKREDIAWDNLVFGEGAWISNSYPIYYFTEAKPNLLEVEKKNERLKRRTAWTDLFVSQTFFYIILADHHKTSYIASSIRVPIVHDMLVQLNKQFFSTVHSCLDTVSQAAKKKIEAVLAFFGDGAIHSLFLPVLFYVLREVKSREEIIPTLIALRDREDIRNFRKWNAALQQALREQELEQIYQSLQELQALSVHLSASLSTEPLHGNIVHIPHMDLLTRNSLNRSKLSEETLVSSCYNPSFAFLKETSIYLSSIGKNRQMIEDIFGHKLNESDMSVINELQKRQNKFASKGKASEEMVPIKIFYCYAHEDKDLRDLVDKHLGILKRLGQIVGWYDREIQAGTEWEHEIERNLNTAHIILLLVSADFIASDYCYGVEMTKALELHRAGQARIVPILLRPVEWHGAPFSKLQMLPSDAKPITQWENQDEALQDVAQGVRAVVSSLQSSMHSILKTSNSDLI